MSALKLGAPSSNSGLSFLLYLEGIFGCSDSPAAPASFLRGLATVSPTSFLGPSCPTARPASMRESAATRATANLSRRFIGNTPTELYEKDVSLIPNVSP